MYKTKNELLERIDKEVEWTKEACETKDLRKIYAAAQRLIWHMDYLIDYGKDLSE